MKEQDLLDQLFENGVVSAEVVLVPGKLSATVTTLCSEDQLELEKTMPSEKAGSWYIIHKYSRDILKYTVKSYGDNKFSTPEEAEAFLKPLPGSVLDKLVKAQNSLEKALRKALEIEKVDEHFFGESEADKGSEPSQKA